MLPLFYILDAPVEIKKKQGERQCYKRTIFISFVEIAYDLSKHYVYYLLALIEELLWMLELQIVLVLSILQCMWMHIILCILTDSQVQVSLSSISKYCGFQLLNSQHCFI